MRDARGIDIVPERRFGGRAKLQAISNLLQMWLTGRSKTMVLFDGGGLTYPNLAMGG